MKYLNSTYSLTIALAIGLSFSFPTKSIGFGIKLEDSFFPTNGTSNVLDSASFLWSLELDRGESLNSGDVLYLRYSPNQRNTVGSPFGGITNSSPWGRIYPSACSSADVECAEATFRPGGALTLSLPPDPVTGIERVELVFPYEVTVPRSADNQLTFGYFDTTSVASRNEPPFATFGPVTAELRDSLGNLRYSATSAASANGFNPNVVQPVPPSPGPIIPTPTQVPGKEYSDNSTRSFLWDGAGGVTEGFDYGGSANIDEIASVNDDLFQAVIDNKAALLFSTTGDGRAPILLETIGGSSLDWAQAIQINNQGINDLDGLQVWGPSETPNANRFSRKGDPNGISIFNFDGTNSSPFITSTQIAEAIGRIDLADVIDVDGLMTSNNRILFSIAPVDTFDGGEIWVWDGVNLAQFLNHGGHLWNTEFDVMGTFGTTSENIDALEAVATTPEKTPTLVLLSFAISGILARIKRIYRKEFNK